MLECFVGGEGWGVLRECMYGLLYVKWCKQVMHDSKCQNIVIIYSHANTSTLIQYRYVP